jgi:hypothetical protein
VRSGINAYRLLGAALLAAGIAVSPGCIGFMSHMMWWMGADTIPAEFPGLKGKRVAVVCESPQSSFGPDADADMLAREIEKLLRYSDMKIELVKQDQVAAWLDQHGTHQVDYKQLAKALKVERVVVVKLKSFSYHENATIYQGQADYTVSVFDAAEGGMVYDEHQPDFTYPEKGGAHITEMPEAKFRLEFIKWLANDVAQRFRDTTLTNDFANRPRS